MKDAEDKNSLPSMGLGMMLLDTTKAPGCGAKELGLCD